MAKPIPDIPGASNQQLRSLKKNNQAAKFNSNLADVKNKQLAEEIVSAVLAELQGSDEFTLQQQNKITDIILGRIAYSKAENDITQDDLNQLRNGIVKTIEGSDKLAEDIKHAAAKCADLVIQSAQPSGNSDEVISQIKKLTDKTEQNKTDKPDETESSLLQENTEKTTAETEVDSEIKNVKNEIDSAIKKFSSVTNKLTSFILSPIKTTTIAVETAFSAISAAINEAANAVKETFNIVAKTIFVPFKAIGSAFKDAKAKIKNALAIPFKFAKAKAIKAIAAPVKIVSNVFKKLNPFKEKNKKISKLEKELYIRLEKIKKFVDTFGEYVVNFVKNNAKKLNNIFKKTLNNIIDEIVDKIISNMKKVFSAIANGIGKIVESVVGAVVKGVIAPILPLLYVIAGIIIGIGAAIAIILLKFPEYAKPIIEVIPKIIDVFGKIVEFVITKLWNFFKEQLWPFIENEIWPFLHDTIWPFFTERIFPIIEMIVDGLLNTVWPFVRDKVWPFLRDTLTKIIDFVLTKVWPFLKDTLVWVRDVIITPIWEKFVVPMLKWFVESIIPFIKEFIFPIMATVLDILNTILLAIQPWIKPIVSSILPILDWLLDLLYKVFTALEPVIIVIAEVISSILVVVFEAIDSIVSPILEWLQKQLINLKVLWNKLIDFLTSVSFMGMRPFSFLDGCKFEVGKPPSGSVNPPNEIDSSKKKTGPSEFIQELVNGIINATDIINDAIKALVFDQVKKKLKKIFQFWKSQEENEQAIDEQALNQKLGSTEAVKAIKTAIEKTENILKQLTQIDNALAAIVKDICKVDDATEANVDKKIKTTAEVDITAKEKEETTDNGFNANEFLDELLADTTDIQSANTEVADAVENSVETAKQNAMSFLTDTLMPLVESMYLPLDETIKILSVPIGQQLEMNTIATPQTTNEPNQALVDQ